MLNPCISLHDSFWYSRFNVPNSEVMGPYVLLHNTEGKNSSNCAGRTECYLSSGLRTAVTSLH